MEVNKNLAAFPDELQRNGIDLEDTFFLHTDQWSSGD